MTSRRQQGHGHGQDDITKVKTLQDATLKASRLYGMMREFIHPAKINYQKIHSKWRNVKKQIQVGGVPPTGETGAEAVPVDDKDCLELPPKLSLHVTAHPDDPKKFIVTRNDGDPLIDRSLTYFAEGLMGHLDKIKMGTEFDIGDADILARIAHHLISLILDALGDDDDEDEDDDTHIKQKLLTAALDAESRNAAASAIIIALIGLIKDKDDDGDGHGDGDDDGHGDDHDSISEDSIASIARSDDGALDDRIRELETELRRTATLLLEADISNQELQEIVDGLSQRLIDYGAQYTAWHDRIVDDLNAANLQQVQNLRVANQRIHDELNQLGQQYGDLRAQLAQIQPENAELTAEVGQLRQLLQTSEEQNAERLTQINALTQQSQQREAGITQQIAGLQQTVTQQQTTINEQEARIAELEQQRDSIRAQLVETERALADAQAAEAADQATIQDLQNNVARLTAANTEKDTQIAAAQRGLATTQAELRDTQAQIRELQGENRGKDRQIAESEANIREQKAAIQRLQAEIKILIDAAKSGNADAAAAAAAAQQLQDKEQDLQRARESLEAARAENQDLEKRYQTKLNAAQQRALDLEQQIAAAQSGTAAEKDAKNRLEQELEAKRREIRGLTSRFDQEKAGLDNQLEQAGRANAAQEQALNALQASNVNTEKELAVAKQRSQALAGQLESLKGESAEKDRLTQQLREANAANEKLSEKSQEESRQLQAQVDQINRKLVITAQEAEAAKLKAEAEASTQKQAIQKATDELKALQSQLLQTTGQNTQEQANLTAQIQAAEARRSQLAQENERVKAEAVAAASAAAAAEQQKQQAIDVLKQGLTERLENLQGKIPPQNRQQQLTGEADQIRNAIQGMRNADAYGALDTRINQLKGQVQQAIEEERQNQDRARQSDAAAAAAAAAAATATQEKIIERLNKRLEEGIPDSTSNIKKRIDTARTLQDECEITKSILLEILDIENLKITRLPDSDACKSIYTPKEDEIRQSIIRINCSNATVESIDNEYKRLNTLFKELREALGDKIRTLVVLRSDDGAAAADISLNSSSQEVSWYKKTVKFSGVFDETKSNVDKYWGVKDLLDKIPEVGSTVVIFGYGYSGSGKTYTLLGKKGTSSNSVEATARRSTGLAALKNLLKENPVPVAASSSETASAARAQQSAAAQNASQSVIDALTAARDILKGGEDTLGVEGVTQLAIQSYLDNGCKVTLEKAFEMYNDTYEFSGGTFSYGTTTQPTDFSSSKYGTCYRPNEDITVDRFNAIYDKITSKRIELKHIKPTPNNPESSRGHLFVQLGVIKNGRAGKLIMCDMGGRENPKEMWDSGRYCPSKKGPIPISRTNREIAYNDAGEEVPCTATEGERLTFSKVFNPVTGNINLETALRTKVGNQEILKTLKQGFYINDSINELLRVFGYKGTNKPSNWTYHVSGSLRNTWEYIPEVRATAVSDYIQMKPIFDQFKEESDCKITFCTFACIQADVKFKDDNIKTLSFAEKVNSCSSVGGGSAVAAAQGGAKTRRNRAQGKILTQRRIRGRRLVKAKSHPVTVVTTQRRNMRDKKKGHRTRKMK